METSFPSLCFGATKNVQSTGPKVSIETVFPLKYWQNTCQYFERISDGKAKKSGKLKILIWKFAYSDITLSLIL